MLKKKLEEEKEITNLINSRNETIAAAQAQGQGGRLNVNWIASCIIPVSFMFFCVFFPIA